MVALEKQSDLQSLIDELIKIKTANLFIFVLVRLSLP